MGKVTFLGLRKTIEGAPQPVGIIYGRNLRKNTEAKPKPKSSMELAKESPPDSFIVDIECPKGHGPFAVTAADHLAGEGCPVCADGDHTLIGFKGDGLINNISMEQHAKAVARHGYAEDEDDED